MKKFAARSPIIFEILLIVAAFVLAVIFGIPCQLAGFETELAVAVGRILAGIVLLAAEAAYAFMLVSKGKAKVEQ